MPKLKTSRLIRGIAAFCVIVLAMPVAATENIATSGAWHLFSDFNAVSKTENFFIVTLDTTRSAQLGLECRKDLKTHFFYVFDKSLSVLPFNSKVASTMRVSNEEPFELLGSSVGAGRIVIEERLHGPSFSLLLMSIYEKETAIGVSIGSYQWLFSLQGFSRAADALGARCGFTPDPQRRRK